jgi:DNA-directed RNA polymerase specialized sigma24 family protein
MSTKEDSASGLDRGPVFATTHWSVVMAAGQEPSPQCSEALNKLCRTYWYPLYAYARRKGHGPEDAQDLTQEFFARLLKKNYLREVHPDKGRFRSFLLACFNHFLAKEWHKGQAAIRGGGCAPISLDGERAEGRYLLEPVDLATPEQLFDRRWAMTLLESTMGRLRAECDAHGKGPLFEAVKDVLTGERSQEGYAALAARLGTTEDALKKAIQRMRARYGQLLRDEVAQTLTNPADLDGELRSLFAALHSEK